MPDSNRRYACSQSKCHTKLGESPLSEGRDSNPHYARLQTEYHTKLGDPLLIRLTYTPKGYFIMPHPLYYMSSQFLEGFNQCFGSYLP